MPKIVQRQKNREQKRQTAKNSTEWKALALKALAAAQKVQDRRALGIQTAITQGTEAKVLRTMHIICDNDLVREFSPTKS